VTALPPIRIATRRSELALAQARWVAARVSAVLGRETELVPLETSGDRLQAVSLAKLGGKGLFVKEIEEALRDGRADLAVHSAKDLPALTPPDLVLAAFPEREDPRDALVARERGTTLATLRRGARVGTGSARRSAQLRAHRPDLEILPLRGNVPTRLRKLESENLDAVVLACAGLARLGLEARIDERIAPELLLPAVAQGTLAIETRADDALRVEIAKLDEPRAAATAAAERAFLARLEGDCNVPIAALAEVRDGGSIRLRGLVSDAAGSRIVRGEALERDPRKAGIAAAEAVLAAGGDAVLAALRAEAAR
jgi:hydroxymethylbilane synthase